MNSKGAAASLGGTAEMTMRAIQDPLRASMMAPAFVQMREKAWVLAQGRGGLRCTWPLRRRPWRSLVFVWEEAMHLPLQRHRCIAAVVGGRRWWASGSRRACVADISATWHNLLGKRRSMSGCGMCVCVRDQLFCSCVYGLRLCFVVDLTVVVLKCDTQRVSVKAGSCERRGRGACERVHAATVAFAAAWHLRDIG